MNCLSASGNAVSEAGDFCLATADKVLLNQPNGAGRRTHEGHRRSCCTERIVLHERMWRYRERLPRSCVDGFSGLASERGLLIHQKIDQKDLWPWNFRIAVEVMTEPGRRYALGI
jgi:hypothetical protein